MPDPSFTQRGVPIYVSSVTDIHGKVLPNREPRKPCEYEGWKVVRFEDDGCVLIESPLGHRRRIENLGTKQIFHEHEALTQRVAELSPRIAELARDNVRLEGENQKLESRVNDLACELDELRKKGKSSK